MENTEKFQAEQLKHMRLQTILIACILAVIAAVGIFAAVQFVSLRRGISTVEESLQAVDMQELNEAIISFTDAAAQFKQLDMEKFNQTVAALTDAVSQFNKMDMQQFNEAVASLQAAAENFADVDVESLNTLVEALETVATRLQNAVNAISGIFGR